MSSCSSDFDSDERVQNAYSGFERCQIWIFVRKSPVQARFYPQRNAGSNILVRRFVPGMAKRLKRRRK